MLCTSCNSRKNEKPPHSFYTADEIGRVRYYLENEEQTLQFKFDWQSWRLNRAEYLTGLGIDRELVNEVLSNENHRYYVPPSSSSQIGFTVSVDLNEILKEIEKRDKGEQLPEMGK